MPFIFIKNESTKISCALARETTIRWRNSRNGYATAASLSVSMSLHACRRARICNRALPASHGTYKVSSERHFELRLRGKALLKSAKRIYVTSRSTGEALRNIVNRHISYEPARNIASYALISRLREKPLSGKCVLPLNHRVRIKFLSWRKILCNTESISVAKKQYYRKYRRRRARREAFYIARGAVWKSHRAASCRRLARSAGYSIAQHLSSEEHFDDLKYWRP